MGLWTGMEERFKSPLCSLFHVDLKQPLKTFEKAVKSVPYLPQLAKVGSVSDFLNSSSISKVPFVPSLNQIPLVKPPISIPIPGIGNSGGSNPAKLPNLPGKVPGFGNIVPGLSGGGSRPNNRNAPVQRPMVPTVTRPNVRVPNIFG